MIIEIIRSLRDWLIGSHKWQTPTIGAFVIKKDAAEKQTFELGLTLQSSNWLNVSQNCTQFFHSALF
jgi:hypothetical protein